MTSGTLNSGAGPSDRAILTVYEAARRAPWRTSLNRNARPVYRMQTSRLSGRFRLVTGCLSALREQFERVLWT
jgi:hypothetical protein